ncbi:hypothetical protein BCR43DRAFT_484098 [Syncephalastrum racemosum]|uniref:Protection of telomeres protein 1 ssDNA-binding domain-containing protein n=1 Tax=Syncephalastrum racemosum TaxID=13706 RepID=A0A1X2HWB9_SYNRA|nr:hypothetical protein BCR43DRAFT_484098 [Syncephalastrum racemosum]
MRDEEYIEQLKGLHVNIISEFDPHMSSMCGVVASVNQIKKTRGDYMQNFRLCDPSSNDRNEVTVNLFDARTDGLFGGLQKGDIVFLCDVEYNRQFGERVQVVGRARRGFWVALRRSTLAEHPCSRRFDLSETDWHVARLLKQWHDAHETRDAVPAERELRPGRPLLRTDEIKEGCAQFFDYACRVIANSLQAPERRVLLVTDFTINSQPLQTYNTRTTIDFEYIMQVTLWDENAQDGASLEPKSLVMLKNCTRKTSLRRAQEVVIRGDQRKVQNAARIIPISPESPQGRTLIELENEYWTQKGNPEHMREVPLGPLLSTTTIKGSYTHIEELVDRPLPSQPVKYKVRAHVMGYCPADAQSWIQSWCKACRQPSPGETCRICSQTSQTYIYQGFLRVMDEHDRRLIISITGASSRKHFPHIRVGPSTEDHVQALQASLDVMMQRGPRGPTYHDFGVLPYTGKDQEQYYLLVDTQFMLSR